MFLYDTASKHHGQYIYMRILETASFPCHHCQICKHHKNFSCSHLVKRMEDAIAF